MFWLILMAGGVGFLLGLWLLRVPLIGLVSAILVVICIAIAPLAQWGLALSAGFIFGLIGALQAGYLAGLMVSWAWARAKAPQAILRSSHIDQCRT